MSEYVIKRSSKSNEITAEFTTYLKPNGSIDFEKTFPKCDNCGSDIGYMQEFELKNGSLVIMCSIQCYEAYGKGQVK